MKVTIGIPHYRSPYFLKRLLLGLCKQKVSSLDLKKDLEIIIVNDDFEKQINESDFKIEDLNINIINQENMGSAGARNKVIKRAKGDIILFLDVDCIPTENWLEVMIRRFDNHADAVGGQIQPIINKGIVNEYYNITNRLETPIVDRKTNQIVTIITANCGFRTKALRDAGGFDDKSFYKCRPGGEDIDLTYRLKKKGFKLCYEPLAIALHEYPDNFSSIFFKYSGYGKGMRIFCLSRKIDPKLIRQPRLNFLSFLWYYTKIFRHIFKSFIKFKKITKLNRAIIFTFFDLVMYLAYGYGYFLKNQRLTF